MDKKRRKEILDEISRMDFSKWARREMTPEERDTGYEEISPGLYIREIDDGLTYGFFLPSHEDDDES